MSRFLAHLQVGSDSPTLPAKYVTQAFEALETEPAVLGETDDGGYYLVGLSAPAPELFTDIHWSTSRVYAETMASAEAAGITVARLPAWYDVDTAADVARWMGHGDA